MKAFCHLNFFLKEKRKIFYYHKQIQTSLQDILIYNIQFLYHKLLFLSDSCTFLNSRHHTKKIYILELIKTDEKPKQKTQLLLTCPLRLWDQYSKIMEALPKYDTSLTKIMDYEFAYFVCAPFNFFYLSRKT